MSAAVAVAVGVLLMWCVYICLYAQASSKLEDLGLVGRKHKMGEKEEVKNEAERGDSCARARNNTHTHTRSE
jgi:hypothetical protein